MRDVSLLMSAVGRPYTGYYRALAQKAAAIVESLARNHGFVDGNKRTAFLIALLIVERSGHVFVGERDFVGESLEQLILGLVEKVVDFDQAVTWFKSNIRSA